MMNKMIFAALALAAALMLATPTPAHAGVVVGVGVGPVVGVRVGPVYGPAVVYPARVYPRPYVYVAPAPRPYWRPYWHAHRYYEYRGYGARPYRWER